MIKIKSNLKKMLLLAPGNSASIKITYSEERSHDILFLLSYGLHNSQLHKRANPFYTREVSLP